MLLCVVPADAPDVVEGTVVVVVSAVVVGEAGALGTPPALHPASEAVMAPATARTHTALSPRICCWPGLGTRTAPLRLPER